LLILLAIYGALALAREFLAICWYRAVIAQSAGLVAGLGFLIECLDLFVLSMIVISVARGGNFLPAIVYAVFSSVGAYCGVKYRAKR
jgi:hypothetical protein